MSLILLPLELFRAIIEDVVSDVSLYEAVKMRSTCKIFNTEVQEAIYALPLFDSGNKTGKRLPQRMCEPMTTRLILAKMKSKDAECRPLCSTISRALKTVIDMDETRSNFNYEYVLEVLARLAGQHVTLPRLVHYLNEGLPSFFQKLSPTYTLIAAIVTEKPHVVKKLLDQGVNPTDKTYLFPIPCEVAARTSSEKIVRIILDNKTSRMLGPTPQPVVHQVRKWMAKGAALAGRENIIRILLEAQYATPNPGRGWGDAIKYAMKLGYEDMVLLLLSDRARITSQPAEVSESEEKYGWQDRQRRQEKQFWYDMLLSCARHNYEAVMRRAVEDTPELPSTWLSHVLSEAVKSGHDHLISYFLHRPPKHNQLLYQGALYWAARLGNHTLVDYLLDQGMDINAQIIPPDSYNDRIEHAVVSAAEGGKEDMIHHLLQRGADVSGNAHHSARAGVQALAVLASQGRKAAIEMLLQAGAEPGYPFKLYTHSDHEEQIVDEAMMKAKTDYPELVKMLEDHRDKMAAESEAKAATEDSKMLGTDQH